MAAAFFFYLFSAVAIASAVMVIAARNPVHSVLFLILAFFNGAGLFVLLGAEFLAMILVVVYVGAVAVLFLFVVMMLDVDFVELRQGMLNYLPVGATIGLILLGELGLVVGAWTLSPELLKVVAAPVPAPGTLSNTEAIGLLPYTRYLFYFQAAGLILRQKEGRRRLCRLRPKALDRSLTWMERCRSFWCERLDALEELLAEPDLKKAADDADS